MIPEQVLFDYLTRKLQLQAEVCTQVPEDPPEKYVVFARTSSQSDEEQLGAVTMVVKSIAPTLYGAVTLNESVKQALREMPETTEVYGVRIQSDYNSTDTRMKQFRYTTVVVLFCPQ